MGSGESRMLENRDHGAGCCVIQLPDVDDDRVLHLLPILYFKSHRPVLYGDFRLTNFNPKVLKPVF